MLHITNIAAITDLNTKAAAIGNKIPAINNVATKATLQLKKLKMKYLMLVNL